jgi:hypothetical protein
VWSLFARQLKADAERLSLAAKFARSESGQHSRSLKADREICRLLHPGLSGSPTRRLTPPSSAQYRDMLSSLRRVLALPEVLMCAQQWTEIDLSSVPSLAMACYKRAVLNESKDRKDDPERIACRDHFLKMPQEKGVSALKGRQLFLHQLVEEVLTPKSSGRLSGDEVTRMF